MKTKISLLLVGIAVLLMASVGQTWTRTGGDLGSRVAALEAQQAINTAQIATNTANIATNAANIATNTANIATNAANIAANTAAIATNTANIATNTANIATNTANIATNTTNIAANAANIAAHIADTGNAHSHDARYVRDSGENLRVMRGRINADGTIAEGGGFTVTKGGLGVYTINFSQSFTSLATVVAMGTQFNVMNGGTVGSTSWTLNMHDADFGAADRGFTFIAIGRQ